jgi:hypothetical protein
MGAVSTDESVPTYALKKDGKIYLGYWDQYLLDNLTETERTLIAEQYGRGFYNIAFAPTILGQAASSVVVKSPAYQVKDNIAKWYEEESGSEWASNEWNTYPPVLMTEEESEEYALLNTDITTYVKENLSAMIVGEQDPEAQWGTFCADLEAIGLSRWLEIKQGAYDRFLNR